MKNKLIDLNNHLFEQLERLNDDDLKGKELEEELKRASGMTKVSDRIIKNGRLMLDAQKHIDEFGKNAKDLPENLQIESKAK